MRYLVQVFNKDGWATLRCVGDDPLGLTSNEAAARVKLSVGDGVRVVPVNMYREGKGDYDENLRTDQLYVD